MLQSVSARAVLLLLVSMVCIPGKGHAVSRNDASKPTLADLTFISGRWQGEMDGGYTEEQWTAPAGDNMMGMFRLMKNGKAVFYELLLIEQSPEGPVLKLKHFNAGLIGWEEKAQVYSYPLIELLEHRAVFERPDKQTRLIYHLRSPDTLYAAVEHVREGKRTAEEFIYKRAIY